MRLGALNVAAHVIPERPVASTFDVWRMTLMCYLFALSKHDGMKVINHSSVNALSGGIFSRSFLVEKPDFLWVVLQLAHGCPVNKNVQLLMD